MDTFDYIVVGAGTAGSVLAARLSEDPDTTVLVLEAGAAEPSPAMANPMAWPSLAGTSVDWSDHTVAQRGADGAVLPWTRGRVLGGSGGINGMMHIRGDRTAYDAWAQAGAVGWDYNSLLPFMKRSERAEGDPELRGKRGPLVVSPAPATDPLWEACFEAAVQAGHPRNDDGNGAVAEGTSWNEMNVVAGRRQSAADAYLRPVLARENLTLVPDAHVRRLVLDGTVCSGVEYTVGGSPHTASAAREVVLTAGAVGTPHLLMLSGIGPADHLRAFDIDVAVDLPGVGANLQDHPKSQIAYSADQVVRTTAYARKPHVLMRSAPSAGPDLQVIFIDLPIHPRWAPGPEDGFSVIFSLMTPLSRGSVRLADPDPDTAPLIDPAYLTHPADVARMIGGLRLARDIGSAPALAPLRGEEVFPGPGVRTDDECHAYLRSSVTSYFHPAGTCAMGSDAMSVVGPGLAVHGIARLRIADACVMPSLVSGNTNAAVVAIAERAASILTESAPRRGLLT